MADIKKAGGLVQQNNIRLLAQRTGQQHFLPLAVTNLSEREISQVFSVYTRKRLHNQRFVCTTQKAELPRVWIPSHTHYIGTGHKLRFYALCSDNG